jgi:hypothetical protein
MLDDIFETLGEHLLRGVPEAKEIFALRLWWTKRCPVG